MPLTPLGRPAITAIPQVHTLEVARGKLRVAGRRWPAARLDRPVGPKFARSVTAAAVPAATGPDVQSALADLAASGVVLIGDNPLPAALPVPPRTPYQWEVASVRARRAAFAPLTTGTTVTALLCTNRPDRLAAILPQMAAQTHRPLQVVVVTHGFPADEVPAGTRAHLAASGVDLVVTAASSDIVFGQALTLGAHMADGDVVTKIDDDDVYGPHHVTDLLVARVHSRAELVGKALQYVHLEAINVSARQDGQTSVSEPELFTDWVCGGTITVARDTGRQLRWFDPVPRAVDRNLQDKVLRSGGRVYRTHGLGYLYVRHGDGHTYATPWSKYLRSTVEQIPGMWNDDEFVAPALAEVAA